MPVALHAAAEDLTFEHVERLLRNTAEQDGKRVCFGVED